MMGRLLIAALFSACALLVLAPDILRLERFAPFAMLLAFRPIEAVFLLLVAVGIVVVRPAWWPAAAAVGVVALPAVAFVLCSRMVPSAPSIALNRAPGQPTLSVLSFNVYNGQADPASLGHTITTERPDLVVLPEAGERYRHLLLTLIGGLGYSSWTTGGPHGRDVDGIVVLAAPSMGTLQAQVLDRGTKFSWIELTSELPGAVRILAVHTAAPVSGAVPAWRSDLAALRSWCQSTPTPVVLVGDFNATLDHLEMRSLGCRDAAADVGRGLTGTWPTSLPAWLGVQIDHVLVGGGIVASGVRVLDLPGSDHRAVLARIALPGSHPAPGSR